MPQNEDPITERIAEEMHLTSPREFFSHRGEFWRVNLGHVLIAIGLFGSALYTSAELVSTVSSYGIRLASVELAQARHDETLNEINNRLMVIQQDIAGIQGTLKQNYQPQAYKL